MPLVRILPLLTLLVVSTWWTDVHAQSYTFTTIDARFPGAHDTTLTGINNAGMLVGAYLNERQEDRGFVARGPAQIPLTPMLPQGINNRGQMTGWYVDTGGLVSFLYDLRQGFIRLQAPESNLT
jgi:hypothetical protein